MFSDLILRNSRRSRKENGLFFSALVVSVVAFYMVLSVSTQDVMRFLRRMESDAVDKLLVLIPVFYAATLVILFFLIYFATRYQLERRRHEFGVCLILGMPRSRLFFLLLLEDLLGSLFALLIGLPVAVVLSEITSLLSAKLVGMGIIGHRFSVSGTALLWTLAGFLAIKLMALLLLSGRICRQEVGALLSQPAQRLKRRPAPLLHVPAALLGAALLVRAYRGAITGRAWLSPKAMGITLLCGLLGTLLLFFGMRALIAPAAGRGGRKEPLHTFTVRQIEETVILRSSTMAVSSLMILAALCFFGAGTGMALTNNLSGGRAIDYTFSLESETALATVQAVLKENGLDSLFADVFEMKTGHIRSAGEDTDAFSMETLLGALEEEPPSDARDVLISNLGYVAHPYLICLSDYNRLLSLAGRPVLTLSGEEAAVYMDASFLNAAQKKLMNGILAKRPAARIADTAVYLTGEVQTQNLVVDRSITLSFALILPDDAFYTHTRGDYSAYVDAALSDSAAAGGSLLNTYMEVNEKLAKTGLPFESFLQNMGRRLFYSAAACYITIYLAVVFLVASNTILGVQFLMGQQKTGRRYQTLIRLGASYEDLCRSAGKQILWFMGLPVAVAASGSLFGVRGLFTGILSSYTGGTLRELLLAAAAMILLLCVVEWVYMRVVRRSSDAYLLTLMSPAREE